MKNSSARRRRIYAPRGAVKTKRVPIGIDPVCLAQCKALDGAQNKSDAAYVLEIYLEGQARRHQRRAVTGSRDSNLSVEVG